MLTAAERTTLTEQLKFIFQQFVETDQHSVVHAVLRLSMEATHAVLELADSLTDVGEQASCGPPPNPLDADYASQVRCPHCHELL